MSEALTKLQEKIDKENFGLLSKKKAISKKSKAKKKKGGPTLLGAQLEFKIGGSNSKSSMTSGVTGMTGGFGFGQKNEEDMHGHMPVNLSNLQ